MVSVPTPGGTSFCIDTTEVTQGEYAAFLASKGGTMDGVPADMSGQPSNCEFNTRYAAAHPDDIPASCRSTLEAFDPTGRHANYPVGCIDWCDAYMYCEWAGKRLCGAIGGGSISWEHQSDSDRSEWFNACSQGGTTAYPYGDTFSDQTCGSGMAADGAIVQNEPASERPDCHGTEPPFDQILNMSGNLAEWTDACEDATTDSAGWCHVQGKLASPPEPANYACDATSEATRDVKEPSLGFRCCLD
jgi:formylglycine-generating enzyme required for sulfatase activity